jgi:hypothetical protein
MQSREEEFGMALHAFSTFLYGMIGYALISAMAAGLWGIWTLRFRQPEVSVSSLEQTIRGWLDNVDLSTKPSSDPTWDFGLLTTLPDGQAIQIIQRKERKGFLDFQANLAISAEHQAILKAMPAAYFEKLTQEIVIRVFLANMVLAIRTQLSDVSFFSQVAVTADLTEHDLLTHIREMDNAVLLARKAILLGVERAPRLVSPRNIRMDKMR